jgi:hypothetical protein
MISFVLLGSGVACFVAVASLLAGLLRSAKASSQVTEEQQDQSVQNDEQDSKEALKNLRALRSVS